MVTQTRVSILDDMGSPPQTHPAVAQNVRNLAQQLALVSSGLAQAQAGSVSAAAFAALQAQVAALAIEVAALIAGGAGNMVAYTAGARITPYQPVYLIGPGIVAPWANGLPLTTMPVIGISVAAAAPGATVSVATNGATLRYAGWAWTPQGSIYCGDSSGLTQSLSLDGWCEPIGYASGPTSLVVSLPAHRTLLNMADGHLAAGGAVDASGTRFGAA